MLTTNSRHAKFVLRSLETTGQPPKWGASLINVGTERYLNHIVDEFLEDHLLPLDGMDGGGACKWIEADYGNGKTQFLRCTQEKAWEKGFVTAFVELSQDECPLDRVDRIFASIAKAIQPPPLQLGDIDTSKGLDTTILQLVERKFPDAYAGNPEVSEMLELWVDQLSAIPVESTSIATAATVLIRSVMHGDKEQERIARAFLRGDVLPAKELREIDIHEKLDKASGFRLLRSMCQFLQRSQLANGIVLLFDEARRSLSLMANKAQKTACENLLSIINKCNSGDLPGTLFLYAVMPEFFTDFATAYPALQQRCGPRTRIPLNELAGGDELALLVQIGKKISDIYLEAYNDELDQTVLVPNLELLARTCIQERMGAGTRRQMVQAVVAMLKDSRQEGNLRPFDEEQALACIEGAEQAIEAVQREQVEDEGE